MDFTPLASGDLATRATDLLTFLCVVIACAGTVSWVYRRVSPLRPDDREFAATLFVLTIAIGLLVMIIKQAPALSFGLFGAMSIVRFRTQIKQPRRMMFILMAVAVGVCCGAGEYLTTFAGTVILCGLSYYMYQTAAPVAALAPLPVVQTGGPTPFEPPASNAPAPLAAATRRWGLDLIPASHAEGRLRVLAITDEATGEALSFVAEPKIGGKAIARELDRLTAERGRPSAVVSEAWPEFSAKSVLAWRASMQVPWETISTEQEAGPQPYVLTLSRDVALECLIPAGDETIDEIKAQLEVWRLEHNAEKSEASASHLGTNVVPHPKRPKSMN